jgi:hypothetical protein
LPPVLFWSFLTAGRSQSAILVNCKKRNQTQRCKYTVHAMLRQQKARLQFWELCDYENDWVCPRMTKGSLSFLEADIHFMGAALSSRKCSPPGKISRIPFSSLGISLKFKGKSINTTDSVMSVRVFSLTWCVLTTANDSKPGRTVAWHCWQWHHGSALRCTGKLGVRNAQDVGEGYRGSRSS